ncbi:MAG: heavy-metal-associated domain-containing protein [Leptolyngbyaceae cyanobacterium CSU_1_3]|nr:heavy-metal-associated domain-containing protein [Leptolyngbyaceae cyanobacterium CSU_1_3]
MLLEFTVPNMACSNCANTITNAVQAIDPSAKIVADLKTKLVSIDTQQPKATIRDAIVGAGYTVDS